MDDPIRRPHLRVDPAAQHQQPESDRRESLWAWLRARLPKRKSTESSPSLSARARLRRAVRGRRAQERRTLREAKRAPETSRTAHQPSASSNGIGVAEAFQGVRIGRFLAIGLLSIVTLTVGVIFSPFLSVQQIEVQGAQRTSVEEIQSALSGNIDQPIIGVSERSVAEQLQQFNTVQSFSVRAELPHTLVVTIVERTPIGVFHTGDSYLLVDAAGVAIETDNAAPEGYPMLNVTSTDPEQPAFAAVASILTTLDASVVQEIREVHATTQDDVQLTLNSGAVVTWGDSSQVALKARVLGALLAASPDAKTYDVSSPNAPVTG